MKTEEQQEFVRRWDENVRGKGSKVEETVTKPSAAARAAKSKLLRRLAGAKRVEAMLKPEAAKALIELRKRSDGTYSAIIEEALIAASKR
jgi:hypothetical protein